MISLLPIALLTALGTLTSASVITAPQKSRIVGGSNAFLEDFPYMVSIRLKTLEGTGFGDGFFCQGVLVSPTAVLTSSECVLNGSGPRVPEELSLVLGTTSRTNATGAIAVEAEQIWVHHGAHLAVLKLERGILGLRPVILNEFQQDGGKQCILMGWGANSTDGKPLDRLQEVYVRIVKENCPEGMICARADKEKVGICFWDIGVPLLCDGSLAGVYVGKPDKCGMEIANFASVRAHWDWIESCVAAAKVADYRLTSTWILVFSFIMAVESNYLRRI